MPIQVITVASQARFAGEKMQKIGLFETDRLFFDLYCLAPGQAQKVHAHAGSDKIYYVLCGRARLRIDQEEQEVLAGQAVLAPSGSEHGVTNAAGEPLTILVFMAPRPTH